MFVKRAYQSGVVLLEALIGILIFSIGILAMVGMQVASVNLASDAQYRIEAVNAANQLLSEMWVSVNRADAVSVRNSLLTFQHQNSGLPADCAFSGGATSSGAVTAWLSYLNTGGVAGGPLLPGATAAMQQIAIDTGVNNRVTITLCWRAPNDPNPRRHTLVAYIN